MFNRQPAQCPLNPPKGPENAKIAADLAIIQRPRPPQLSPVRHPKALVLSGLIAPSEPLFSNHQSRKSLDPFSSCLSSLLGRSFWKGTLDPHCSLSLFNTNKPSTARCHLDFSFFLPPMPPVDGFDVPGKSGRSLGLPLFFFLFYLILSPFLFEFLFYVTPLLPWLPTKISPNSCAAISSIRSRRPWPIWWQCIPYHEHISKRSRKKRILLSSLPIHLWSVDIASEFWLHGVCSAKMSTAIRSPLPSRLAAVSCDVMKHSGRFYAFPALYAYFIVLRTNPYTTCTCTRKIWSTTTGATENNVLGFGRRRQKRLERGSINSNGGNVTANAPYLSIWPELLPSPCHVNLRCTCVCSSSKRY